MVSYATKSSMTDAKETCPLFVNEAVYREAEAAWWSVYSWLRSEAHDYNDLEKIAEAVAADRQLFNIQKAKAPGAVETEIDSVRYRIEVVEATTAEIARSRELEDWDKLQGLVADIYNIESWATSDIDFAKYANPGREVIAEYQKQAIEMVDEVIFELGCVRTSLTKVGL